MQFLAGHVVGSQLIERAKIHVFTRLLISINMEYFRDSFERTLGIFTNKGNLSWTVGDNGVCKQAKGRQYNATFSAIMMTLIPTLYAQQIIKESCLGKKTWRIFSIKPWPFLGIIICSPSQQMWYIYDKAFTFCFDPMPLLLQTRKNGPWN